jgi:hypothetical protein
MVDVAGSPGTEDSRPAGIEALPGEKAEPLRLVSRTDLERFPTHTVSTV